ncbi:MAG: transposase, partial [Roseobacter sp.]|nr:transposase [Roseobacter sp.]
GQRGFAVVNVTNGTDVNVWFITFKLCLSHGAALYINEGLNPDPNLSGGRCIGSGA